MGLGFDVEATNEQGDTTKCHKKTKSDTEGNQNNHIHILQAFCSKERTAKVELEASRVSFPSGRRRDLEDTIQLMTTREKSTKHLLDVIQHVCCTADAAAERVMGNTGLTESPVIHLFAFLP